MKQSSKIYNAALYLRLSRDDELQGESGSIQSQRMMLREYARENRFNIVDEYIDDGWSGTNFDRPGFQRMIDDIEEGKVNCVITKDLSRLGRNYILTGQYTEIYFPSKGQVIITDNIVPRFFILFKRPPLAVSRPIYLWASLTIRNFALKRGTKRRAILKTRLSAGMIRPNRYTNLSEVITSV